MRTSSPTPFALIVPGVEVARKGAQSNASSEGSDLESLHYPKPRPSRLLIALAVLVSASVHAVLLSGFNRHALPTRVAHRNVPTVTLTFILPQMEEVEITDVDFSDAPAEKFDAGSFAPTQPDLPTMPRPGDFVQQLDFASLLPRPDLAALKVVSIPPHIAREGTQKLVEHMGPIFNLADLDRPPVPLLQVAPIYPSNLKRGGVTATVDLEFVVDVEGRVLKPFVISATYLGFEQAAITGVLKWRFRPGLKNGQKVNTRMRVPIVFRLIED